MAEIIPPEFYGLYGLGSQLGQFAENLETRRRVKRKEKREDEADKVQQLLVYQSLFPNNPEEWMDKAEELGIVPPGSAAKRTPTLEERFGKMGVNPQTGLTPEQTVTIGGETVTQAQQATVAGAQGILETEQDIELKRKQNLDYENTLKARREYEEYLKLSGKTPGGLDAMMKLQDFDTGKLQQDALRLNMSETRARIARINLEMQQAREAKDPNADFYELVSKNTFLPPSTIKAAYDPTSKMDPALRKTILGEISTFMEAEQSKAKQVIRDNRTKTAFQTLENLYQIKKNAPEMIPDDMLDQATTAAAISAGMIRTEVEVPRLFGLLGSKKEARWSLPTDAMGRAETLIGASGTTSDTSPTMSTEQAAQIANTYLKKTKGNKAWLQVSLQ